MNIGYNNRWIRLIKDIVFVALGCWLFTRHSFFAVLIAVLAIVYYGRDAWFQAKALWQEKTFKPRETEGPGSGPTTDSPADDGKITITNLDDAKEVDFKKE